jgi:DNA polymerase IV
MIPFTMQMSLFDNNIEKLKLYKAVDDIKDRFGSKIMSKAVTSKLNEGSHQPTTKHNKKKTDK